MSSSTATAGAWPEPRRFALGLLLSFAVVMALAWAWGRDLVQAVLPLARALIAALDHHFAIQFLGIDRDTQDTVVRLRVQLMNLLTVGKRVAAPTPGSLVDVTTTVGTMLQPIVIALGFAGAWPGTAIRRLQRVCLAGLLGLLFLLIDLPLTLYAYVWDIHVYKAQQDVFSPLLMWHNFLHAGGRLGVGVLLALAACAVLGGVDGRKAPRRRRAS